MVYIVYFYFKKSLFYIYKNILLTILCLELNQKKVIKNLINDFIYPIYPYYKENKQVNIIFNTYLRKLSEHVNFISIMYKVKFCQRQLRNKLKKIAKNLNS